MGRHEEPKLPLISKALQPHEHRPFLAERMSKIDPFRPKRGYPVGTRLHNLMQTAETRLQGDMYKQGLAKPPNTSSKDWYAVHVRAFYNLVSLYLGALQDHCKCAKMTVTQRYEYRWADGRTVKQPVSLPAMDYAENLMGWIDAYLTNIAYFPDYDDAMYLEDYPELVCDIFKRLLRLLAHMIAHHASELGSLGLISTVRGTFMHMFEFARAHKLVDKKNMQQVAIVLDISKRM